jgi:hypothetical protein
MIITSIIYLIIRGVQVEKKGFMGRLKILSKPTGKPQWKQAIINHVIDGFSCYNS